MPAKRRKFSPQFKAEAEKANYAISWKCALLGVPRSTFYYWKDKAETQAEDRRHRLTASPPHRLTASPPRLCER